MHNLDIVRDALLKQFTSVQVSTFMEFLKQDEDLLLLVDKNVNKAIDVCTEILRIALDKTE